jgi:hypothetical protein
MESLLVEGREDTDRRYNFRLFLTASIMGEKLVLASEFNYVSVQFEYGH